MYDTLIPTKNSVFTGFYKLTQNPGELILRGFTVLAFIHSLLRHRITTFQFLASNHSARASSVNPGVALESHNLS
jgi:hypothetical protein